MDNLKEQEYAVLGFCYQNDLVYKYGIYSKIYSSLMLNNTDYNFLSYNLYELYGSSMNPRIELKHFNKTLALNFRSNLDLSEYDTQCLIEAVDFHKYLDELSDSYCVNVPHLLQKTLNNNRMKTKRVCEHVKNMLGKDNCYFMTYTFNEKAINSDRFKKDKFRSYFSHQILKDFCLDYIGNEDYGSINDRFHYHAVIVADSPEAFDLMCKRWSKYGFIKAEKITVPNQAALGKYVLKLTRHAVKASNKKCNLISCRSTKNLV